MYSQKPDVVLDNLAWKHGKNLENPDTHNTKKIEEYVTPTHKQTQKVW
jgi:hypothetical protein